MPWYDPFNILNPGKPYKEAGKQYEKGWQNAQQYQKPYWQSGRDQIAKLTGAENKLLNPAALQDEWSQGYEMSPYAQQLQSQAKSQGFDALSSMGLLGSSAGLQTIQQGASNIMQKDRQNYMDDLMQKYLSGIGIGTGIYGQGAQTGANLGSQAMDFGSKMGEAKFGESDAMRNQMVQFLQAYLASQGGGY